MNVDQARSVSGSDRTRSESQKFTRPKKLDLPMISIVVPNFNGEKTLGKTLDSLIAQHYPKLEIIVVDGGSTDGSVEVIRQYESQITWWVSEGDRGQSHGINKGFAQCRGEIVNWLCSDDYLMPGALMAVGEHFAQHPEVDVAAGRCRVVYEGATKRGQPLQGAGRWLTWFGKILPACSRFIEAEAAGYIKAPQMVHIDLIPVHCPIAQPSCFYRRSLLKRSPPLQEDYHYAMDWELWAYFSANHAQWSVVDQILSVAVMGDTNKTSVAGVKATYELERIYTTYIKELVPLTFWHRLLRYPIENFLHRHRSRFWVYVLGPIWVMYTLMLAPFYGLARVWSLRWSTF